MVTAGGPASPQAFVQKLGIKPGHRVALLDAPPAEAQRLLAGLPEGCQVRQALEDERFDCVLHWPGSVADWARVVPRLAEAVYPSGALWMVIPKQAVARRRGMDVNWATMVQAALALGLVDNKDLSFGPKEYGTRFVWRRERR